MKITFRWYGEEDPVTLSKIRQIPCISDITTAVYKGVGTVWEMEEIEKLKNSCNKNGLSMEVIESINLGFSGSAKGEDAIADYIANLEMSIFVYDYDWNAPTPEHLENTHEKMFKKIRSARPDIPIICMSRPGMNFLLLDENELRKSIVKKTVENAKASGDKNVYFIDGSKIAEFEGDGSITVDGIHPNDLGFKKMAEQLLVQLRKLV